MDQLTKILRSYFPGQPVKRAFLFGSFARGDQDDSSDIDLLIELDEKVGVFKFVSMQLNLEELLGRKVDLISANGISRHIAEFIDSEKKLVYERPPRR